MSTPFLLQPEYIRSISMTESYAKVVLDMIRQGQLQAQGWRVACVVHMVDGEVQHQLYPLAPGVRLRG